MSAITSPPPEGIDGQSRLVAAPDAAAGAPRRLLRTLIPETATPEDPVPFRTIIFQIQAEEMIGREATPGNR